MNMQIEEGGRGLAAFFSQIKLFVGSEKGRTK